MRVVPGAVASTFIRQPDALHKDAFNLSQLHHMNHDSGLLFLIPSNNSTVIIFFLTVL